MMVRIEKKDGADKEEEEWTRVRNKNLMKISQIVGLNKSKVYGDYQAGSGLAARVVVTWMDLCTSEGGKYPPPIHPMLEAALACTLMLEVAEVHMRGLVVVICTLMLFR